MYEPEQKSCTNETTALEDKYDQNDK